MQIRLAILLVTDNFIFFNFNQKNNRSRDIHYQDNILDISSGLLHLAGDSLIPESINKSCLEDAKVLQQVDKKFIAVVAGGTLAVIDQVCSIYLDFSIQFSFSLHFFFPGLSDEFLAKECPKFVYVVAELFFMNMIWILPLTEKHSS